MKAGLIRCMQTEEVCPASRCLESMLHKKDAFAGVEGDVVCVGVSTCGGCRGKKAGFRAKKMVERGAEAIVVASCITLGTPINFPCPFAKKMKVSIREAVGENIRIFEYSHEPSRKKATQTAVR